MTSSQLILLVTYLLFVPGLISHFKKERNEPDTDHPPSGTSDFATGEHRPHGEHENRFRRVPR